ncbi:unnamed protein product, partial [Symbiodinium pilosum]
VLSCCAQQQRWQRALSLFSGGGLQDVVTHAATLTACEVGFRYREAAAVMFHLDRTGLTASLRSF